MDFQPGFFCSGFVGLKGPVLANKNLTFMKKRLFVGLKPLENINIINTTVLKGLAKCVHGCRFVFAGT